LPDRSVNQKNNNKSLLIEIMPRTKEQYEAIRLEKKELIRKTSLTLFAVKGYNATSISDIAKAAGISKGLMYNYFTSKEDLLQYIMDELSREYENFIDPDHDGQVTEAEAERFIDCLFDVITERREEMKLYYQLYFQPSVLRFIFDKFNSAAAQKANALVLQYFSDKISMDNPEAAMLTIVSFVKGVSMVYTYSEERFTPEFIETYKSILKKILIHSKNNL
jgi:AcrR family transcriptional regulator